MDWCKWFENEDWICNCPGNERWEGKCIAKSHRGQTDCKYYQVNRD